jgi:hypothetical protein
MLIPFYLRFVHIDHERSKVRAIFVLGRGICWRAKPFSMDAILMENYDRW